MILLITVFAALAIVLPALTRFLGRGIFILASLVPFAALVFSLTQAPRVLRGEAVAQNVQWIPQLAFSIGVRLDVLSWALTLVVTAVGGLVLVYCAKYFRRDEVGLGRFAGILLAFTGAMYGLVVADDVYLLFVFWEATSVFSYLLIGHYTGRKESRGAALQALLVTTLGGLVMLIGLVILAGVAGTSSLAAIVANPPGGVLVTVAIMLVLVGALSKSAIVPFHFWLPAAMAAPTPVSAYLHAAAMVKAGIYLIARLAPGFSEVPGWREVLVILGVITMLVGGWTALKQHDLKLVLAHGTVSQLGFLTVIVGFGNRDAALVGIAYLLAHALFKSTLFLVVGIIDHRAGTRDLRKLSGLGKEAPVLATIAIIAAASMVGLPPALGFAAKEGVLAVLFNSAAAGNLMGWVAIVGVSVGSILTTAYTARFIWGSFATKAGVDRVRTVHESVDFLLAPAILVLATIALGLIPGTVGGWLSGYSGQFASDGGDYSLALWHGVDPALLISAATLAAGIGLFLARKRFAAFQSTLGTGLSAAQAYWASMRFIDRMAARTTSFTQRGSLPFYLGVIYLVFGVFVGIALALNRTWPTDVRLWDYPAQLAIGAVMIAAALAATRAGKRFQAVVLVGVTGFGMSALFALQGAPDLALTQILVEIVTLVAFVLVLRRLPAKLGDKHGTVRRGLRAVIGVSVGLLMAAVAMVSLGARSTVSISAQWPRLAVEYGHGTNVVNVALVDIRAWDTMGELAVIIAAATGVASLIFLRTRADEVPRLGRQKIRAAAVKRFVNARDPEHSQNSRGSWLLAGRTLADHHRSILLEVVVRLIFHAIIIVSLYLLFAGHNAPGGGFAGGLVAGLALVARYIAGGRYELAAAAPIDAGKLLGVGLGLAATTAIVPLFFGYDALTTTWFEGTVWLFGHVEFVTSTIFDVGVYLVVVGLTLDVLRSLGAEVDRHYEDEKESATR